MTEYFDISDRSEDARIRQTGLVALERPGKNIALITDDFPGKAERYVEKLQEWFPSLEIVKVLKGPTPNAVSIIIVRPLDAPAK